MANPYPANFEALDGSRRLTGQVNFTDPANQPGGGGSQTVLQATHNFTAAQVRSLFTDSPVTLIAAPGAGKVIVPLWIRSDYAAGSHPFFSASGSGSQGTFNLGADTPTFVQLISGTLNAITDYPLADSLAAAPDPFLNFGISLVDIVGLVSDRLIRSTAANQPLTLSLTHANITNGEVTSSTINATGSGYAAGDTLADDSNWGAGDLLVTVNTVDGSGHVLTYTMTNKGTSGWAPSQTIGFINVAPQSGAGSGFKLMAGITPGDGTLKLTIDYEVLTLS